jgi:hypothetical protein
MKLKKVKLIVLIVILGLVSVQVLAQEGDNGDEVLAELQGH